jgi:hypothetical protein
MSAPGDHMQRQQVSGSAGWHSTHMMIAKKACSMSWKLSQPLFTKRPPAQNTSA